MIKKILILLLFLIVVVVSAFFIWYYISYQQDKSPHKTFLLPRLELSIVEITSLTADKTQMKVKMLVKNQLPFTFTADSLQYSILINDVEVIRDTYKKSAKLESNDSSWISLPVTILNHQLKSILKASKRKNVDSAEYRFQASFYTDIIFRKKIELDIKKTLPLIYIPEVTSKHLEIESLNFSRAEMQLHLSIKNQNVFPLQAKNIAYKFAIEDNEWIDGIIPGLTDIKAKSVSDLQIPVTISFKEVGKTLIDLLIKGESVKYKLHLTLMIESEEHMIMNSKVILESSGSVKSLMKSI